MNGRDFPVHIVYFCLIQTQGFHTVLVRMGMQGFLKGLSQQVLPAFGIGNVTVYGEDEIISHQGIGWGEESQVTFDNDAFVAGQPLRIFPQSNIGIHIDFLWHPVIGAAIQVFLPGPFVFERYELIEIGPAVDHLLVINTDPLSAEFYFFESGYAWLHWISLARSSVVASSALLFIKCRFYVQLHHGWRLWCCFLANLGQWVFPVL